MMMGQRSLDKPLKQNHFAAIFSMCVRVLPMLLVCRCDPPSHWTDAPGSDQDTATNSHQLSINH